jgi:nicotinamidase-related amidase
MSASRQNGGGRTALLVIDMLNAYEHEDADRLAASAEQVVPAIARMIERARGSDAAIVYVNDNYGDWSSSAQELTEQVLGGRRPDLVEPLVPPDGASFVIKPRHSAFFQTPLEYLLQRERIGRLVLTGQATEQCILYSALDAYVRHFEVVVPADCVAHIHPHLAEAALEMMRTNMRAEIGRGADCSF